MDTETASEALAAMDESRARLSDMPADPWWFAVIAGLLMGAIFAGIGFGGVYQHIATISVIIATFWRLHTDKNRRGVVINTWHRREGKVWLAVSLIFYMALVIVQFALHDRGGPTWAIVTVAVFAAVTAAVHSLLGSRLTRRLLATSGT